MSLSRKISSAIRMVRQKGWADASELARLRATQFYAAHRPVPSDCNRRARQVALALNGWSGVSAVPVTVGDLSGVRDAVVLPYLRLRFAEAAAAAGSLGALRPLEIAILADCVLKLWDFRGIVDACPAWTAGVAGTAFARRIEQMRRRAALRLGRLDEAARGLDASADDLGALVLRGDVCDALGRMDEAREAYGAAIRRDGTDAYARQAYGLHLMKAGHLKDGLASWAAADALMGNYPLRRRCPHWTGEPLGTRRLMVLFEHGLGDMIQMARFLPRLLAREPDAVVMGRVPAPLLGLLAGSFPTIRFVSEDEPEPAYDLFVPSMHLLAVLDAPDLAPRTNYIDLGTPAPTRPGGRQRVGVCWRGFPRQYEVTRSIPLDTFASLFAERGVDFTVLLNRLTPDETERLAAEPNVEIPAIRDFMELAALVASCDLVVSVDTAVVHLAGAGGARTLLLSRPDPCWRWGASGSRGPWYDSVEVLRHGGDMDWHAMLLAVADRIRALGSGAIAA